MALDQLDVEQQQGSEQKEMTFLEHLEELRWHLIRSGIAVLVIGIAVFLAKDLVFRVIIFGPTRPDFFSYQVICQFADWVGNSGFCLQPTDITFVTPVFGELFITHIKVSIVLGLVVAFPYVFWEMWRFIMPGLYDQERKAARGVVLICSALFMAGVLFGYFVIAPFAVTFLTGYNIPGIEQALPALSSYINYLTMFTVPAGLIFELPVVVYFLSKIGLITPEFMRSFRRHSFIVIIALSAMITPPDVVTQFLIAVPLYILYEISIVICKRVTAEEEAKLRD